MLEFLAIIINFFVFSPHIPTGVRIVVMTNSLTSVDTLADGTAHAPLIQWLHMRLLTDDHLKRLASLALVEHGYGKTNAMSDARSRGCDDHVARLCAALCVRHVAVDAPSAALELLDALRARHYTVLGVVDGKRPTDNDSSESIADSTKRRATDPFCGGVRIGEASNAGPTPMQTPAAARRQPLAQSPTPPAQKRAASPPDDRGSPAPPAPPKRALGNRSPTVFSTAFSPVRPAAPAALPTPLTRRSARAPSPTPFSGTRIARAPSAHLVRPVAIQAGVPTPPAAKKTHAICIAAHPPWRVSPSPAAPLLSVVAATARGVRGRRRRCACRAAPRR